MNTLFKSSLFALIGCLGSVSAYATPVSIETGNYNGNWKLNGSTNAGSSTVDLAPGSYNMQIAQFDSIDFEVASDGTVTSLTPAAAEGGANSLALKTTTINIDPVNYEGRYRIPTAYNPWFSGLQEIIFVTGLDYRLNVGYYGSANFHINEDGTVNTLSPDSLVAAGSTVTFNNTTLEIDPADYLGSYALFGASAGLRYSSSLVLVPGVKYAMEIGLNGIGFNLDAAGNVEVLSIPEAVNVEANKITFNTASITVDPAGYKGAYYLRRGNGTFYTMQNVVLVRGITTRIVFGNIDRIAITLDSLGNLAPTNRDDVLDINGNTVTFNNIDVEIAASGADFQLDPYLAGDVSILDGETTTVTLVPNLRFHVRVRQLNDVNTNIANILTVQSPCAAVPGSHEYSIGDITGVLTYSCPSLIVDMDEDSIPDESDNCPTVANTDQLDMDEDGEGDACDPDIDGDTVENINDNCPTSANTDQADLDHDGLGNACDSDIDGDGVQDTADNCPLTPNAGQGNSDSDTQGDACDNDDDNDNVLDTADNCPVTPNTNQSDIDADGEGDMCDGDRDGDGIENTADQCTATPADSAVDMNGCNGAQFIAMVCVADDYKNHGQYVSCVTKAAKEAVSLGLIDKKEKSTFVTEAAQSK